MKLSSLILFVIFVAAIFFIFALMVREANLQYPDADINSSEWDDKYDYIENINSSIAPIRTAILTIENTEVGWFTKIGAGLAAIPFALVVVPKAAINAVAYGGSIINDFFQVLKVPIELIAAALVILSLVTVFKLIEWWKNRQF